MPREIWNEGRVVGLSAYETYVKQHMSEDPSTPPATEREWLASSIAMGSSMLLKMPTVSQSSETAHTYLDVPLPATSRLAAANTIIAQFFDGDAEFVENWATKIVSYGPLVANTSTSSPSGDVGPSGSVPTETLSDWDTTTKTKLKEYMKIQDGVVIQPGKWVDNESKPPEKDFQANLSKPYPRIRLHIRGSITNNPLVLFTGFTIRSVLSGIVGQDTAVQTSSPQDGDFLGPAVFPWAAKIMFCVPTSFNTYCDDDLSNVYLTNSGTSFVSPGGTSTGTNRPRVVNIQIDGDKSAYALMMSDGVAEGWDVSPTQLPIGSNPTSNPITLTSSNSNNNLFWSTFIDALKSNRPIDLLGNRLKSAKDSLVRAHSTNAGPYLEFGPDNDKLRLYISDTCPPTSSVPEGSIGIGWGLNY